MNKEFVLYEQALVLKELGFAEPCQLGWYLPHSEIAIKAGVEPNFWQLIPTHPLLNQTAAPTFSQAFRWFREKHNLCGEVYTVNMGAIDYTFQIRDLYSEDVKHDNFEAYTGGYTGTFLTHEEAELACLIKLIEIVKTK
jgi:hypothetical protein